MDQLLPRQMKCAQCKKEYKHGNSCVGCPKCAPNTSIAEEEFIKPIGPTWEETNKELDRLKSILISLHNRPERDWELHEKDAARIARRKCIELGEYRYKLLRTK